MRTRSQQQSPGNFVSLENPSRRTRSTRSASQTKTANTTNATDRTDTDPTEEEPSGPSKQPATRAKSQRVTKKKTATTTKKKVTKAASSKPAAKATRKSTRKAAKATSEEPETHADETPETTPETDENKENADDAIQNTESETATAEHALAEKDDAQSESTHPLDCQQPAVPWTQDVLHSPHTLAHTAPSSPNAPTSPISNLPPVGTIAASWAEIIFGDISNIGSPLSERSRIPSLDEPLFADGELDEILLEQVRGPLLESVTLQEGRWAGHSVQSTEESAWEQPEAPSTFESPAVAEPTTAESMESVAVQECDQGISQQSEADSLSASTVGSGGGTVAVSEQVDDLTQQFTKLGLAELVPRPAAVVFPGLSDSPTWQPETVQPARDPISVSSTVDGGSYHYASQAAVSVAPVEPRGPSIFDEPPPSFELSYIGEFARRQAQQTPSLISLARPRPRTYYDVPSFFWAQIRDERRVLAPEALAEDCHRPPQFSPAAVREPSEPSHTASMSARLSTSVPGSRPRVPAILSPIPEQFEPEMSPGPGRSKVGAGTEVAAGASASSAASQAPMVAKETYCCLAAHDRSRVSKKLTRKKVNRKRTRSVVSDEETAAGGPETPIANKRRNLGVPGSTPFARRLPPLSRRLSSTSVPYSERLRRRQAERNGRIHRTVFRLPEYIAQEMADRQAAETASQPEPPLTHVDGSEDPERSQGQDQQVEDAPAEPSSEQASAHSAALPSALPETPRRGWNIRGLLNSVPRSFSRLIPGFGRPSAQNGQPEQSLPSSDSETTKQSASGIDHTVDAEPEFTTTKAKFRPWKPRRRLTTGEPPQKRRNLEYSLFPAPMDRSLYLGDIATPLRDLPEPSTLQSASLPPTSHPSTIDTRPHEPTIPATSVISESSAQIEDASSATQAQETRGRETPQQASSNKQKKRKRAPSPDVIPNPPGCSYGMDTDYFWYSSESEDEGEDEAPEQSTALQQANGLARTAVRSALRSDRPASKKVRFDASPEDTPSKLRTRARATDPYTGSHFIGMGSGSPSSPTPNAPNPAPFVEEEEEDMYGLSPVVDPRTRPGFIPNTQGTFQLDYDAFSDDDSSESGEPSSPTSASAPSSAPAAETPLDESPQSPATSTAPSVAQAATPRQASIMPPSTPAATVDDEALAKVRSLAEKHKPKTPSRLRTASRYSSPMTITPDARIESAPVEDFGDDEFAQDAQWLYEHCPSGDLTKFQWPDRQGYKESLEISQTVIDVLAKVWNDSEVDEAHNLFCQGFEEFKQQA